MGGPSANGAPGYPRTRPQAAAAASAMKTSEGDSAIGQVPQAGPRQRALPPMRSPISPPESVTASDEELGEDVAVARLLHAEPDLLGALGHRHEAPRRPTTPPMSEMAAVAPSNKLKMLRLAARADEPGHVAHLEGVRRTQAHVAALAGAASRSRTARRSSPRVTSTMIRFKLSGTVLRRRTGRGPYRHERGVVLVHAEARPAFGVSRPR